MNPYIAYFKSAGSPPELKLELDSLALVFDQTYSGGFENAPVLYVKILSEVNENGHLIEDQKGIEIRLDPVEAKEIGRILMGFAKANLEKHTHIWQGHTAANREKDVWFNGKYRENLEKLLKALGGRDYPEALERAVKHLAEHGYRM